MDGLFRRVSPQLREAFQEMARHDAPAEMALERSDLAAQRTARRRKEEIALEVGRDKVTEQYVDQLYYTTRCGNPMLAGERHKRRNGSLVNFRAKVPSWRLSKRNFGFGCSGLAPWLG